MKHPFEKKPSRQYIKAQHAGDVTPNDCAQLASVLCNYDEFVQRIKEPKKFESAPSQPRKRAAEPCVPINATTLRVPKTEVLEIARSQRTKGAAELNDHSVASRKGYKTSSGPVGGPDHTSQTTCPTQARPGTKQCTYKRETRSTRMSASLHLAWPCLPTSMAQGLHKSQKNTNFVWNKSSGPHAHFTHAIALPKNEQLRTVRRPARHTRRGSG